MTVYQQSVSSQLRFISGSGIYPDTILFPATPLLPPGKDGIFTAMVRSLTPSSLSFSGAVSNQRHTISLAAVLRPTVVFARATSRSLSASLHPTASLVAVASVTINKFLFASLSAAGSLQSGLVIVDDGGGGFSTPMPDAFFQRYKPTLRRQKMRV